MKKVFYLIITLVLSQSLLSQSQDNINYQAVARDANNKLIVNQEITVRISVSQSQINSPAVYIETHKVNTNQFGLFNLAIGSGSVVFGDYKTINWGLDDSFIKIEIDPNGGTNYTEVGTNQLLSVPYALYAKST
jgi:hypothetical protein